MTSGTTISYHDLDEIQREFLKYAPAYAQREAVEAIWKVRELQSQGVIRDGVYYLVLLDLVGSTKFSVENGNDATAKRIEYFVTSSFWALNESQKSNVGLFVKEIGDAVLYIFQHFPDILRWKGKLDELLSTSEKWGHPPIVFRTCIHIGEVSLHGVNPLSLAVSQTFKMEKSVSGGDVVLTDPAYHVAWPSIARAYHGFREYGSVDLDGFPKAVDLHQLVLHDAEDAGRIAEERFE